MKLNKKEKEILAAYEKGLIKTTAPSKKELKEVKTIAENTFRKDRRITIRLYDHDFKGIQNNQDLNRSLKRALKDVKAKRGRFFE